MINRYIISIHVFIALTGAAVLFLTTKPLLASSETVLMADAVISGSILSILFFLLKHIIKYGNFSSLIFRQKIINYCALGLLFIVCWLGIEYLILHIFFPAKEYEGLYTTILPTRVFIASLVYCLIISIYSKIVIDEDSDVATEAESKVETESKVDEEDVKTIEKVERIVVKNGQKIDVIMITEIVCILAEGDYVMIHTVKGKFLKEQTMKSLEKVLPSDRFVRIHRSSIVNVEFIAQIELYNKQSQLLKLKNGMQVKVSLSGYKSLKDALGL